MARRPTPAILLVMPADTSSLDPEAIARARALVDTPKRKERTWPVLAAAFAMALAALTFATAMILAPPVTTQHVLKEAE